MFRTRRTIRQQYVLPSGSVKMDKIEFVNPLKINDIDALDKKFKKKTLPNI